MSTAENTGYNRETLLAMLHSRIVEVKYRKADGEKRLVRGTLQQDILPAVKEGKTTKLEEPHPNLVTLWDVDEEGWRSIRTDRIIEVM